MKRFILDTGITALHLDRKRGVDGSDTDALSRSFNAPLGPHRIPL